MQQASSLAVCVATTAGAATSLGRIGLGRMAGKHAAEYMLGQA